MHGFLEARKAKEGGNLSRCPLQCSVGQREGRTMSNYLAGIQRDPAHKDSYALFMDNSNLLRLIFRRKLNWERRLNWEVTHRRVSILTSSLTSVEWVPDTMESIPEYQSAKGAALGSSQCQDVGIDGESLWPLAVSTWGLLIKDLIERWEDDQVETLRHSRWDCGLGPPL